MESHTSMVFRKSSYSQVSNCVEVADAPGMSAVRDTKNRETGMLAFSSEEWRALVLTVRQEA
ncbi:uncharacterized protein DUF397 [Nocardiopsis sp. Huas11]|uniref:DUF397 domain-containing protein n=1 Tax=Nocardiopsis sp. Huas11 TaxID=2183912 RepID=UPI000EB4F0EC|nr:DUF397 domain-containing protein [Nocardiopsis sp. Huas11]RKS07607.1 uncharacterized protein DUF397 [Nocardiopsis sp. Huas11]